MLTPRPLLSLPTLRLFSSSSSIPRALRRKLEEEGKPDNHMNLPKFDVKQERWPPSSASEEILLPGPFKRRVIVYNARNKDGRTRSTVLSILGEENNVLLSMTREEFEGLMKLSPEVEAEMIRLGKLL